MKNYQIWTEHIKNGPLIHEYEIYTDGEITTMHRTDNDNWSDHAKGEKVGEMKNSGDDLVITLEGMKKPIILDYMQAHQLLALLMIDGLDYKSEVRESRTLKQF